MDWIRLVMDESVWNEEFWPIKNLDLLFALDDSLAAFFGHKILLVVDDFCI